VGRTGLGVGSRGYHRVGRWRRRTILDFVADAVTLLLVALTRKALAAVEVFDYSALAETEVTRNVLEAASAALDLSQPRGPGGIAAAHVFTFADQFTAMLCHLARSVEAAGGWLHVLGLREGEIAELPWGELDPNGGSSTRADEPWHFANKAVMLKKHIFLARAIRHLPGNSTVVFVDGFDVLFQRPLADLVAAYRRIAGPAAAASSGIWPVVFGGERNCWPFPHQESVPVRGTAGSGASVHKIPMDAMLSAGHNGGKRYPYGDESPWSILGSAVCGEWLARRGDGSRGSTRPRAGDQQGSMGKHVENEFPLPFPFLCSGTFMGTASSMRHVLWKLFNFYTRTHEYHDQALFALLLLRNRTLGLVDTSARLFLGLHGHDEFQDLERPLCRDGYFMHRPETRNPKPQQQHLRPPVPGYETVRTFAGLSPPAMRGESDDHAPPVLHFNGNGKRHLRRCVEEFRRAGVLGGRGDQWAECTYFDEDRRAWARIR